MDSKSKLTGKLLDGLTPEQIEAVTHVDGPMLILAAAGSGKTRVITRRIAYLLSQGISPHHILAITFTNKAANEMRQRVDTMVKDSRLWISTFHSMGVRLLRLYAEQIGIDRNFTIYDIEDRNKLIKLVLETSGFDRVRFSADTIGSAISKAKNQLLTPEKYAGSSGDYFTQVVAKVYAAYQRKLKESNALDFDDLLYIPAIVLQTQEALRHELDQRFRYILVDEYQDTNEAQYVLIRQLSRDFRNICVVGDPDQSIYRWRGSDIKNILQFEKDFPEAHVITLEKNFRSTPAILQAAGSLIEKNTQRKKKNLLTDNPPGKAVRFITYETGQDEAIETGRSIRDLVNNEQCRYRDVAIFVRMNALTRTIESAMVQFCIPFQIVKGLGFFDRKENKDIIAYVRLLVNPNDQLSFLRIVNEPPRGIGKTSLEKFTAFADERQQTYLEAARQALKNSQLPKKAVTSLMQFSQMIDDLSKELDNLTPPEMIEQVMERSGYRAMLKNSQDDQDEERLANIEELITATRQFAAANPDATIRDFLEQITLASDVDSWDEKQDCVSVMTLHASKGLEFPYVFMLAVEEGILPHIRSMESGKIEEIEEERRLAFVGMTRAMKELVLSSVKMRDFRGQTNYSITSMFVDEMGSRLEHIDKTAQEGRSSFDRWRYNSSPSYSTNDPRKGRSNHSGKSPRTDSVENWSPENWPPSINADSGKRAPHSAQDQESQYQESQYQETDSSRSNAATPRTNITKSDHSGSNVFERGDRVKHDFYGEGEVLELSGTGAMQLIRIRFQRAGEKRFMLKAVRLTRISK